MEKDNKKTTLPGVVSHRDTVLMNLENLYHAIILQQQQIESNQPADKKKKKKKPDHKIMSMNNVVKTLNLKFYAEQLMHTFMTDQELDAYYQTLWTNYQFMMTANNPKTAAQSIGHQYDYLFERFKEHVRKLERAHQAVGGVHDKDEEANPNDFFIASSIKSHCHLSLRRRDGRPFRISTALKMLGIVFRRYIDNELWGFGVTTCRNFASCIAYLTHETPKAEAEGKYIYDRSIIFSNCDTSEVDDLREGYLISNETRKLTNQQLASLDKLMYESGYEIKDFAKIYGSLPFNARSNSKMRTAIESYHRGVNERLKKEPPEINRVCLFIQGPPNTGKTYACKKALEKLGYNVFFVTGGGNGKFDALTPSHNAILIDDETCPNLLNMTDSRATTVYRRNKNNPFWLGNVFVVTSNLTLDDWCVQSKLQVFRFDGKGLNAHGYAMHSRFICCHVERLNGTNQIVPDEDAFRLRGTDEEQKEKADIANKILSEANQTMSTYQPHTKSAVAVDAALFNVPAANSTTELTNRFKEFKEYWFKNFFDNYDAQIYFGGDDYQKWLGYGMPSAEKLRENFPKYNIGFRQQFMQRNPQKVFEKVALPFLSWCVENKLFF